MNSYAQAVESYAQFRKLLQSFAQGWEIVWDICSKLWTGFEQVCASYEQVMNRYYDALNISFIILWDIGIYRAITWDMKVWISQLNLGYMTTFHYIVP